MPDDTECICIASFVVSFYWREKCIAIANMLLLLLLLLLLRDGTHSSIYRLHSQCGNSQINCSCDLFKKAKKTH